jgi:hypothetical protein
MSARNWSETHWIARSTRGGGRPKSGEVDLGPPVKSGRVQGLGKLHGPLAGLAKHWLDLRVAGVCWPWWPKLWRQWRAELSSPELRESGRPVKMSAGRIELRPGRLYKRGRARSRAGALTCARGVRGERQCALWRLAQRRARGSAERGQVQTWIGPKSLRLRPRSR